MGLFTTPFGMILNKSSIGKLFYAGIGNFGHCNNVNIYSGRAITGGLPYINTPINGEYPYLCVDCGYKKIGKITALPEAL